MAGPAIAVVEHCCLIMHAPGAPNNIVLCRANQTLLFCFCLRFIVFVVLMFGGFGSVRNVLMYELVDLTLLGLADGLGVVLNVDLVLVFLGFGLVD